MLCAQVAVLACKVQVAIHGHVYRKCACVLDYHLAEINSHVSQAVALMTE